MEAERPAQRDAVVRIVWTNDVITSIAVSGRPDHPYRGTEGSHTTAWAVFADTLRRQLRDQSLAEAVKILRRLIGSVNPGAGNATDGRVYVEAERLSGPRKLAFQTAAERAAGFVELAAGGGELGRQYLRDAAAAYLTTRNLAPLASVDMGVATAKGRGEPAYLKALRRYEQAKKPRGQGAARDAIWGLLDTSTLPFVQSHGDHTVSPGVEHGKQGRNRSAMAIVVRHLWEIAKAYPRAYAASDFHDRKELVRYLRKKLPASISSIGLPADLPLPKPIVAPLAPLNWSAAAGSGSLATIELRPGTERVMSIGFAGRGKTLLREQGHHITAHVAVEAAVEAMVRDRDLTTALQRLLALADDIVKLPTFPTDGVITPGHDPKALFQPVLSAFAAALESARRVSATIGAPAGDRIEAIESLAASYVALRNVLPMAAVLHDGLGNHRGEARAMELLRSWADGEDDYVPPAGDVCGTLWKLLDWEALAALGSDTRPLREWAPAAPAAPLDRIAGALGTHLDTVADAFDILADWAEIRTVPSVAWLLAIANIPVDADGWNALVTRLKLTPGKDGGVQPNVPFGDQEAVHDAFETELTEGDLIEIEANRRSRTDGSLRSVKRLKYEET